MDTYTPEASLRAILVARFKVNEKVIFINASYRRPIGVLAKITLNENNITMYPYLVEILDTATQLAAYEHELTKLTPFTEALLCPKSTT